MYSFEMAPSIRQKVDEFMNCEDIAMAFLVAHTIRKPPVRLKRDKEEKVGTAASSSIIQLLNKKAMEVMEQLSAG